MADVNNTIVNADAADQKHESKVLVMSLLAVIVAVIVLAIIGFCFLKAPAEVIEGQADATSVKVSGMLPGRVTELYVKEGDMVKAGDTLVHIHSGIAEAKLYQAQEMKNAATAVNEKVDAGARIQIIQTAEGMVAQASAAVAIAKKTYDRMQTLYNEQVVSEQKRDEAKAAYDAAVAAEKSARAQLSLAKAGAQKEDKQSSQAMVGVAQGGVEEIESLLKDQYLLAPCDGQVDQIYPELGELVSLGAPIMSILKTSDKWVTFNVREELLSTMKLGDTLTVMIPAMDKKEIPVAIYYVRDMGSYATWRATKATGEWDSRTFQIKARPLEQQPDLRPGMTVVYRP